MQEGLNLRPNVYEPPALPTELRCLEMGERLAQPVKAATRRRLFGGAILARVILPGDAALLARATDPARR